MSVIEKPKGSDQGGRSRKAGVRPAASAGGGPVLLEGVPVAALCQACRRLQAFWDLEPGMMAALLGTSRSTWFRWLDSLKAARPVPWTDDQRTRALALLRIYEAVADLHHDDRDCARWVHEPLDAPGFEGRTPLAVMASGFEGLLVVRDYLDFLHGAWT